jgi:hypothetical protein
MDIGSLRVIDCADSFHASECPEDMITVKKTTFNAEAAEIAERNLRNSLPAQRALR